MGWWEELERWEKKPGKKSKMILHWKRILREAGIDWTDVERLTGDMEGWKKIGGERRWRRTTPNAMNAMRINWQRLKEEEKNYEFVRKTAELMEERGDLGEGEVWKKRTGLMTREAEEVCGVVERQVMNPWMNWSLERA